MTNRVQTLRSAVAGARPTGRSPGELYTNWPDYQIGVINAAGTAVDLLAVRFFSTTASYVVGDFVRYGSPPQLYRCNAVTSPGPFVTSSWDMVATGGPFVSETGDTMTGDLTIAKASPGLFLNKAAAGQVAVVWGQKGGSNRWAVIPGDGTAEGGANAGSDFSIMAYTDAGAYLSTPLVINRATGRATLQSDPVAPLGIATKQYVDTKVAVVAAGVVVPYAGGVIPSGWLLCDGANKSRSTYSNLFAAIGTNHGIGDGSTTFGLPDLRGRVVAGVDGGAGRLNTGLTGGMSANTLGAGGGESAHTPTLAEDWNHTHAVAGGTGAQSQDHSHTVSGGTSDASAYHNHTFGSGAARAVTGANALASGTVPGTGVAMDVAGAHTHTMNFGSSTVSQGHTHTLTASSATAQGGGNTAHNNVQPTLVLNYMISTGGQ